MQRVLQGIAVVYHPHCSRDEEGKQLDIISTTIPKTALIHSFGSQNVIIKIQHTHPRIKCLDSNGYLYFLIQLYLLPERKMEGRKGMGELLPKGQLATELAADQHSGVPRTLGPVRPSSDKTHEPTPENSPPHPIGDPTEACQGRKLADISISHPIYSK